MSKPIAALWALLLLTSFVDDASARPAPPGTDAGGVGNVSSRIPRSAEVLTKPAADESRIASHAPHRFVAAIGRAPSCLPALSPAARRALQCARVRAARPHARAAS